MYAAGQETTSTSLRWGLLMMAKHPHIQKRVQDEIDAGIGHREPLYEDRLQLPFTESVMHESMRFTTTVPLAPHRVMSPVQIDGYDLPVGTYVIGNLYAMLHDPKVWPDPDHFNPDANFPINVKDEAEKEKLNARLESFIPFSVGKRMCVGDTLARQEFFIIFVGLLQHFTIAADPSKPLPSEYIAPNGTTRVPLPHKLVFQRRA